VVAQRMAFAVQLTAMAWEMTALVWQEQIKRSMVVRQFNVGLVE
jgi:hypothetical protein